MVLKLQPFKKRLMHYINPYIESCLEDSSSPLKDLNQKDKDTIAQHHTLSRIRNRGYLFREGERMRGLVILASGKAKLYRIGIGGREHILKMMKAYDIIGLSSLFTEPKWPASSMAVEESVICTIEKQSLLRILRINPDLSMKFNKFLAEELSHSYNKMVSLTQKHVRGRLVESLLMLVHIYGFEADGRTINVTLSRNDIAHLSNMTTSNAIRTLSNLASEGNIKLKGRKIAILNLPNLERISEQA
jgi:CRP/FNR family transcriptional regulator, polysaccharide utilization system transcription regulator